MVCVCLRLVKALAHTYSPLFGRQLDPLADILGMSEASFMALFFWMWWGDVLKLRQLFFCRLSKRRISVSVLLY